MRINFVDPFGEVFTKAKTATRFFFFISSKLMKVDFRRFAEIKKPKTFVSAFVECQGSQSNTLFLF